MAPRPDGAELQRTESFQYPAGHLGHLNETQRKTLEQFKQISQEKGYWTPATATQPASHDDENLLRYLRARKFVPSEAYKQFKETEDWRAENQLDTLYDTIDVDEYEQSRRLYPQWLGRRDKRGIPIYLFEIAHLDNKALAAYEKNSSPALEKIKSKVPPKMLRLFALYENLCRFVLPLCSTMSDRQHTETPISQSSNIVDISGVSLMQFWKLKNHMQDASILATAHYPETLDRIFLLGAPSFFPTVWSWVKRWFDPITVSKIFVLSQKETLPTLEKFIDIENIPKKYGGKLDFSFGDLPKIDKEIAAQLKWTEPEKPGEHRTIPTGPIRWRQTSNGDLQAVAVGSVRGVQRKDVIAITHPASNVATMSLSPGRIHTDEEIAGFAPPANATASDSPSAHATGGAAVPASANATTSDSSPPAHASAGASNTSPPANTTASDPLPPAKSGAGISPPRNATAGSGDSPQTDITAGIWTSDGNFASSANGSASGPVKADINTGTSTLPYRDNSTQAADKTSVVREGTSATRYEQQANTHADGTVSSTPAIAKDGQGEKQAIMEPSTVGQAPKEHPVPDTSEPPTMIEQAQHTAEAAFQQVATTGQSVLAAVGLGGTKAAEPVEEKTRDPEIDGMEGKHVEEFLRAKTQSTV